MRYYRIENDWVNRLEGKIRTDLIETLQSLSLERLQKYPPPKLHGLPFGNETRILKRYFKNQSSQLDASVFSNFYLNFADQREKLLYEAFRQNKELSASQWSEIIGEENIEKWVENKFLRKLENGNLRCIFTIIGLDGLIYLTDPLNDHGGSFESVAFLENENFDKDEDGIEEFHHTYIGLDSLRMIEVMQETNFPKGRRFLDCGPGAGAILLYFSRYFDEAVGIDLNPRAAKLAKFNAELNQLDNCKTFNDNALEIAEKYGKFDYISWNLPFIFMPDEWRDNSIDGDGGDMGIGLCLAFIETLPEVLSDDGKSCVAALSPILNDKTNVLEKRLKEMLPELKLDCTVTVAQISLADTKELWDFHQSYGIQKFESVYLDLRHGTGELKRVESKTGRKVLDTVREKLYQRKYIS